MKQARAIVDERTTIVCLDIHGIIMPVDQPFETLAGDFMQPPFHIHCRTLVGPHMAGFIAEARREANKELKSRPAWEKRRGEGGPDPAAIPRPVTGNPPSGFSRRDEEAEFKRVQKTPLVKKPAVPEGIKFKAPDPVFVIRPENMARDLNDRSIPRDEFPTISPDHKLAFDTLRAWSEGQEGMDRVKDGDMARGGKYLEQILAAAPPAGRPLYRGMIPFTDEEWEYWKALGPGDTVKARTATSFTSNFNYSIDYMFVDEDVAEEEDDWHHPDAVMGVQMILEDGRAVDMGNRASSGAETEWLVGDMVVDRIVQKGPKWIQIFVKNA